MNSWIKKLFSKNWHCSHCPATAAGFWAKMPTGWNIGAWSETNYCNACWSKLGEFLPRIRGEP